MKRLELPSQERLRELFDYDEVDRARPLVRKVDVSTAKKGDRTGTPNNRGIYQCNVDGQLYKLYHIVWIWHGGKLPCDKIIDHRQGDIADNRIGSLQCISQLSNLRKQQKSGMRKGKPTSSAYKGVSLHRSKWWSKRLGAYKHNQKWRAVIFVDGKSMPLGCHDDEESAARAYDEAALEHYGMDACTNFPVNGELAAVKEMA